VKCPKCGTDVLDLELRDELRLNRIILIAATVVIVLVIMAATIYAAGALKPRPELVAVLEIYPTPFDDGSDGWYRMRCSGYIFNVGPVGCFAEVNLSLSDDRGWSYEITEILRWMPAGGSTDFYDGFDLPTVFNEQEADLDGVQLTANFRYLDSEEWYEEVDSWLLPG
jgi:hypothetical protein